ncbi:hypothetical protein IGI04_026997 [Brassica rapa subsp. trilocularis]|uniref:Uncharacterized protein n=1 Tax=Brassica rapa subsp. trilocularis TaxID=1813537 RepID=A0ABQ7KXM5_BRACM|nr:hypothetical protein IGI04_026997 [Brassica rapa subsp. trilocularis]
MSISSCRLLRLIDYIRSFFCCAVQVIPAMMWGGTSSIGSGFPDYLVRNCGAIAQLHAIFE